MLQCKCQGLWGGKGGKPIAFVATIGMLGQVQVRENAELDKISSQLLLRQLVPASGRSATRTFDKYLGVSFQAPRQTPRAW